MDTEVNEMVEKFNAIRHAFGGTRNGPQLVIRLRYETFEDDKRFYCCFDGIERKGVGTLDSVHGDGDTPKAAMKDYLCKIRNQTLVYKATDRDNRKEIVVL